MKTNAPIKTGIRELDKLIAGFYPGDLIVIGGRPSVGKTALALNFLDHICIKQRRGTVYYAIEAAFQNLLLRIIGLSANLPVKKFKTGSFNSTELQRLNRKITKIAKTSLNIEDSSSMYPAKIKSSIAKLQQYTKVELIIIDYFQLLALNRNRDVNFDKTAKLLKQIAVELKIPIIVLAQLNRTVGAKAQPQLKDFRYCSSLPKYSDVTILLDREITKKGKRILKAGLIVAKNSRGKTAIIKQKFNPSNGRFSNL